MNNKGRIVVFISMITAVMLVLITLVIQVVILSAAKSKNVIATRLSMSDIKACYNSYIFEHYHILLLIRLRRKGRGLSGGMAGTGIYGKTWRGVHGCAGINHGYDNAHRSVICAA